ncbi:unnamed protein product, partial [Musa acuminata var. zebrina]
LATKKEFLVLYLQLRKGGFAADEPSKILYFKQLRDHSH